MVFPVVMYGCESWTMKKAEHRRIDAFELWFWRRLLRVPWTARRSNQSILNEISPEYSLEGLTVKLKLQYFGLLMGRTDSLQRPGCWESLKAGEKGTTEDNMVGWHYQLDGHELSKLQLLMMEGKPVVLQSMGSQRVGHNWATELNLSFLKWDAIGLEQFIWKTSSVSIDHN